MKTKKIFIELFIFIISPILIFYWFITLISSIHSACNNFWMCKLEGKINWTKEDLIHFAKRGITAKQVEDTIKGNKVNPKAGTLHPRSY